MMRGVQLSKNKYRNCLFNSNLLDKFLLARALKFKNTQFNNILNRPRWKESNAATLYYQYFGACSYETFHTFSYIADFLELIYYETIYENEYFEKYNIRYKQYNNNN